MSDPRTQAGPEPSAPQSDDARGPRTPRGIRLNNPGNIRYSKDKWQGMADVQLDEAFVTFKSPEWGIRAIARILLNYKKREVDTVEEIISRWAPPSENNTASYIRAVSKALGVEPDTLIDVDLVDVMLPLIKAIIRHENGIQPYSDELILKAIRMAGVSDAPQEPLSKKLAGKAITGTGVALGLASEAADPAKSVADGLGPFTGSPIIQAIVTIALTVAGLAILSGIVKTWIDHRKGL